MIGRWLANIDLVLFRIALYTQMISVSLHRKLGTCNDYRFFSLLTVFLASGVPDSPGVEWKQIRWELQGAGCELSCYCIGCQ